jgi:hypothetical protein
MVAVEVLGDGWMTIVSMLLLLVATWNSIVVTVLSARQLVWKLPIGNVV